MFNHEKISKVCFWDKIPLHSNDWYPFKLVGTKTVFNPWAWRLLFAPSKNTQRFFALLHFINEIS